MADFDDIIRALQSIPGGVERATRQGLRRGAVIVMGRAKRKLGTYQPASGDYPAWPKLKPYTVAMKYTIKSGPNKGFFNKKGLELLRQPGGWKIGTSADGPLVDSGHLGQAITVDESELDGKGAVYVGVAAGNEEQGKGSPGDYAATHEFGDASRNIPQRSFLRPALHESREEIKEEMSKALMSEIRKGWR